MQPHMRATALKLRRYVKAAEGAVVGRLAVLMLRSIRLSNPERMSAVAAACMRRAGPWLPEHHIGRANLQAAFPEKSPAEIEEILLGVWANLGRFAAEFPHLDRLWDFDLANTTPGRVEFAPESLERFIRLRDDGKPALIFAAHLGNWELPALAAASHGLDTAILYRRPNMAEVDEAVRNIRSVNMGRLIPTSLDAPVKVAHALERGTHVGMLVDQYYVRGVDVTFFGRRTKANPLIARLLRQIECPLHGVRIIRLPGDRFRAELTDEIAPVRAADGRIDIAGTMQVITTVVEGWVREYPDQWLWLHRRWR
jgi:Kdo2-lipid IVA lauroyltransferase/acyltransferase